MCEHHSTLTAPTPRLSCPSHSDDRCYLVVDSAILCPLFLRCHCSRMLSRCVSLAASVLVRSAGLGFIHGRIPLGWGDVRLKFGGNFSVSSSALDLLLLLANVALVHLINSTRAVSIDSFFCCFRDLSNQNLSGSLPEAWGSLSQVRPALCYVSQYQYIVIYAANTLQLML